MQKSLLLTVAARCTFNVVFFYFHIFSPDFVTQRYRLGVKHAMEYGHLLEGYDKPIVTRTTSEDRMVESGYVDSLPTNHSLTH